MTARSRTAALIGVLVGAFASGDATPAATAEPEFPQGHALVIGIATYADPVWPDLSFAEKDARAVARTLRAHGFRVTALYNAEATRGAIVAALEDRLPRQIKDGDRLLLFYSGHGHTRAFSGVDYGYIVPHDAGAQTGTMIAMDTLQTWSLKMSGARHQLFIMDACFGGLLAPKGSLVPGIPRDHPAYISEVIRRDARQYLTAGGRDQQVLDGGPKGYSYFTGYLLEALDDGLGDLDGDGYITASELASYLIPRATNRFQTPGAGTLPGHGLGDFVFRAPGRKGLSAVEPGPTGEIRAKGPATAALPLPDTGAAGGLPGPAAATPGGPGIADRIQARGDEVPKAIERVLRQTGYGKLATARVNAAKIVRVVSDRADAATLEVRYYAVNNRTRDHLSGTLMVEARIEDGRLEFRRTD